jgi:hypothetical protein
MEMAYHAFGTEDEQKEINARASCGSPRSDAVPPARQLASPLGGLPNKDNHSVGLIWSYYCGTQKGVIYMMFLAGDVCRQSKQKLYSGTLPLYTLL